MAGFAGRFSETEARAALSWVLHRFARIRESSDSIGDRAIRLGVDHEDAAVLIPLADFEHALELEDALADITFEELVCDRLARGKRRPSPVEDVARELGLAHQLGFE